MAPPELTHESKAAIRNYLLTVIALPGICIALLPFAVSYFVKDVATQRAELEAERALQARVAKIETDVNVKLDDLNEKILQFTIESLKAQAAATSALREARQTLETAEELKKQTERLKISADVIQGIQKAGDFTQGVIASLQESENFIQAVGASAVGKGKWGTELFVSETTLVAGGAISCRDGTYATGIKTITGEPSNKCPSCLIALQVTCRDFR
jgi:uncharacterized protein (DUF4415 family)